MSTRLFDEILKKEILEKTRMPRLRIERARIVTQSYEESAGYPMILRRAMAMLKYAQEIPISIEDWQLVVGSISADNFTLSPFPESTASWAAEIDIFDKRDGDKYFVSAEDKAPLAEILSLWRGKSIEDNVLSRIPEDVRLANEAALIRSGYVESGCGNYMPDYRRVLKEGLQGFEKEILERIEKLDWAIPADYRAWQLYEAALICIEAASVYARRLSALSKQMVGETADMSRRRDLEKIARHLDHVPLGPARDFAEALQSIWIVHCLAHFEAAGGVGIVLGRMDQYLYPLFEEFRKQEEESEAKRWLANFWINQNQLMYFLPKRTTAMIWSGHPISEQPTIGGLTPEGRDASNDLTQLILEVEREIGLPRPDITVMVHDAINPEVMHQSALALPAAMKPKFFNYKLLQKHLRAKGVTDEEIRDEGVIIGCVTSGVEGKVWGNNQMGFVNLGKVMELAMADGVDQLTGKQVGPRTGNPESFRNFDDLWKAFEAQLEYAARMAAVLAVAVEFVHQELNPQPLASMLTNDCLATGKPVWEGGARYNIPGIVGVGLANTADSLVAVRRLVFTEQTIEMRELCEAMSQDWVGRNQLRKTILGKVPKYGNDEEEVDELAARVAETYARAITRYKGPRSVSYFPGLYSVSAHVGLGEYVAATPDGRKARTPLADGTSPSQGMVRKGPTAILKSMTRLDQGLLPTGTLQNMKLSRSTLEKHEDKFIAMIKTYMDLGGYHVQFNIFDTATLIEAQKYPEKYAGLVVRVAAYAAEFTSLPKALQDDIINRSEIGLDS